MPFQSWTHIWDEGYGRTHEQKGRAPGNGPFPSLSRKGALTHHLVVASSTSFAQPQAAGLIRFAAPPLPTKLRFAGAPFGGGIPPSGRERALSEGVRFLREAAGCGLHKGLRKKCDYAEVTTNSDFPFIGESDQPWHRPFCGGSFCLHEL